MWSSLLSTLALPFLLLFSHTSTSAAQISPPVSYNNTLIEQRADPHILKHSDGWYYFTATVPAYDQIILRRAQTIQDLASAAEVVVFERTASGFGSGQIWAPELHHIDGKWYIYVALGVAGEWRIRMHVFEGVGENPLEAVWENKGVTTTDWDEFSLDATTFVGGENGNTRFLVWAQFDPTWGDTNTCLFIAPMENPWTVRLPAVAISRPDLPWERIGHNVNEGAHVLHKNGRIFLTYSASATDSNYQMGLLTAADDADLMDPASWAKSAEPIFASNAETEQWGPGHNSFTVSEDGRSDLLVFHDRGYKDIDGDPLNDPNRRTRVQKVYWREDGTPDLGIPVPDGQTPVRLRASEDAMFYVAHDGVGSPAMVVGSADAAALGLASTLFRIVEPGLAGEGTVSLEASALPGRYLVHGSDDGGDAVTLQMRGDGEGGGDFAAKASFVRVEGLAGSSGTSFEVDGRFLVHGDGVLMVAEVEPGTEGDATFYLE